MPIPRSTSRILTALSAAICLSAGLAAAPAAAGPRPSTLGELAAKQHKYFGSATDNPEFTDAAYLKLLGSEFGQTTPGNAMKWYATEPGRGVFDFTDADKVVSFAKAHHQKVRATPSSGTTSSPPGSRRVPGAPTSCAPSSRTTSRLRSGTSRAR